MYLDHCVTNVLVFLVAEAQTNVVFRKQFQISSIKKIEIVLRNLGYREPRLRTLKVASFSSANTTIVSLTR